jgi:Outer membrane cobalamin receptor protein
MNKLTPTSLMMAVVLAAGADQALAQTEPITELETVVVTGRKIEEKLSAELAEYGHQVVVIDGETIEKLGFIDITEALSTLVPGLWTTPGRGESPTIMINGGTSSGGTNSGLLWLLDGVRLNNRLYGGAYTDAISTSMIERIEVLMGGEGLFYGTNSTSGVINIITKKPTRELSGQVGATYGSLDQYKVNGYISRGLGEHQLLAFGSYEEWGGYRTSPDALYALYNNKYKRNRAYDRANYGLKYRYEFGEGKADRVLELHLQRNEGTYDQTSASTAYSGNSREEYIMSAKWEHDVNENFSYYVKAYYHDWWSYWNSKSRTTGQYTTKDGKWGSEDFGVNILGSYIFDRGDEVLVGIDYQNYWGQDYVNPIKSDHEEVYALFFQYRPYFAFWPKWKVAMGARYNYLQNNDSFVWNISSRMPIYDDHFFLRASVGTSFILPNNEQLFLDRDDRKGNPNLEPQESLSVNVGLGTTWEKFDLELSAFYEKMEKKIGSGLWVDTPGGGGYTTYYNVDGESTNQGFTISGTYRPVPSLSLNASYTRQKAKENGKENKRGGIPQDYASVGLNWNDTVYGTPVGVGLSGRWTGTRPLSSGSYYKEYGNYWLANASFYANVTEKTRVSLLLNNIFDKNSGTWARTSTGGQTLVYQNNGAPFTATLSVSYSF